MTKVFVLITCDYGQENKILEELSKIDEVLEVNKVEGPYNILVKIDGETIDTIKEIITLKIKTIDRVRHTLTLKIKS